MSMLIVKRREGEDLQFTMPGGAPVRLVIEEVRNRRVKFSIHADEEVKILRGELVETERIPADVHHDARRTIVPFPRHRR